uniref:Putative ovule protein n=1 Tax=Solanum chacoense TaxID=4108 RepID=A0A0V0I676_SOLCH
MTKVSRSDELCRKQQIPGKSNCFKFMRSCKNFQVDGGGCHLPIPLWTSTYKPHREINENISKQGNAEYLIMTFKLLEHQIATLQQDQ